MANVENSSNGFSKSTNQFTAGIIVIGDEILKGQTMDTNSAFLTKKLFHLGVKVKKISVVPDELNAISDEITAFSSKFNFVITSGGIGPTHDDLTFEGIAKAFDEKLYPHPEIINVCKKFFGTDDLKNPKLKIAYVPESAKLLFGYDKISQKDLQFPLVVIKNVYVFPGVPHLMEKSFQALEDHFRNPDGKSFNSTIYLDENEYSITHIINEANQKFGSNVALGSYPKFHNNYYKVCLTLESPSKDDLDNCMTFFLKKLQHCLVTDYDRDPILNASDKVYNICQRIVSHKFDAEFCEKLSNSLKILEKCFNSYKLDEICVGFNGGKDCTALLHLVYAVIIKTRGDVSELNCLYIRRGQPFPEVEHFIKKTVKKYNIKLHTVTGRIKDALISFKSVKPNFKAVIMGTRLTDPHSSHLQDFSPTDEGWPEYMRVHPILHWTYGELWSFIRNLSLPYCSLYDVGYSSLGSMENTHPNPSLQRTDSKGNISYNKAYTLTDFTFERSGRN
ncbi:hypothetical protein HELRODRAFT_76281 [Helobdella robusta]|uniref:FAD synthase n=1 Tax=Helobdella robusta TaxID=6412 RepID=T1G2H7_HELRO|nr:hypothetical protein HELRODRAFT_76281 [Helobdella robusta]ESO07761.1 hypothetical protein HELRODRAFT_76281 [Helobdella robusta]